MWSFTMRPLIILTLIASASGHGNIVAPTPRAGTTRAGNNKGNNRGPCGQGAQLNTQSAATAALTLTPGSTLTVQDTYPIPHGGTCRVSLAENGASVQPGANIVDGQGRLIAGGTTPGNRVFTLLPDYNCGSATTNKQITIPAEATCNTAGTGGCVLQWFWDGDANYYNCVDIAVQQVTVPDPAPAPTPPVAPNPVNPNPVNPNPNPNPVNPNPANPNPNPGVNPNPTNPGNPSQPCSEADEMAGLCGGGQTSGQTGQQTGSTGYEGMPTNTNRSQWRGGSGGMGMVASAHWTCTSMPLLALAAAVALS